MTALRRSLPGPVDGGRTVLVLSDPSALEAVRAALRRLRLGPVGVAATAQEALAAGESADLVLFVPPPGAEDPLAQLTRARPGIRAVLVEGPAEGQAVLRAIRAGAAGYLHAGCEPEDLRLAIRTAQSGAVYVSPAATRGLLHRLHRRPSRSRPRP